MKRLIALAVLILVVGLGTYTIFAQQEQPSDQPQQGRMGGGMGDGMMPQGPMPCPMCAAMMHQSVTATSDGGVVVAVAGKLVKYDGGLNKVGETNVDIDWARMHQMAQQMVQNCPMHRRMMQRPQRQPQSQWQGQGQQTP